MVEAREFPKHVGIILDGNRRFAKKLAMAPWKGHEVGAEKVSSLLEWAKDLDIKELTLYSFSMQNFNRSEEEKSKLWDLMRKKFSSPEMLEKLEENKIRVCFLGRIEMFPDDVRKSMEDLMEKTKDFSEYRVNFAMAYGGQEEIIDAVKKVCTDVKTGKVDTADIDIGLFEQYLYTDHKPDFIIRTGGDHRTSNFLVWQSNYSEWFFLDKKWPEFEKEDLKACVESFCCRERRFGK